MSNLDARLSKYKYTTVPHIEFSFGRVKLGDMVLIKDLWRRNHINRFSDGMILERWLDASVRDIRSFADGRVEISLLIASGDIDTLEIIDPTYLNFIKLEKFANGKAIVTFDANLAGEQLLQAQSFLDEEI